MGIIKKQSIQSTIYNYLGVGLGFLNSALLLPLLLSEEQVGMLHFLNSYTSIFASLCTLGIPLLTVRMFPSLRNEDSQHHGFMAFVISASILGSIIGVVIHFGLMDWLLNDKNAAKHFAPFGLAFTGVFVLRVIFRNFDAFIRMQMNTVLGSFLENFLLKVGITIILVVYWWVNGYDFKLFFMLYAIALSLPGIVTFVFTLSKNMLTLRLHSFAKAVKGRTRELTSLSLFGLLGALGTIIVLEVDRIMVSNMLGLEQTAIYTTAFFFGLFCSIPSRALRRIAQVVIAEAWEKNDLGTIRDIYHKSSLNLFLIGLYLFLGVWLNIDYVLQILPESYASGKTVILIIGFAQLVDLVTGVNNEIISASKYYRYITYLIAILIILVIVFNYFLIPTYGINGAALASLLAIFIYNIAKLIFLKIKLNYQPLNFKFIAIAAIGGIVYLGTQDLIPTFDNIYIGILITGSALTLLYWIPVYFLNLSEDVNSTIDKFLGKKG